MVFLLPATVLAGLVSLLCTSAQDLTTITASPSPTGGLDKRQQASTTYETTSPLPLTDYLYPYNAIPERVNPYPIGRGPQSGYNICNDTTQGPDSQCQTTFVNSISDFCIFGAPGLVANQSVGDIEAAVVSYCAKAGHGGRIFPPGTFSALQFMRTDAYIQIVGLFNQTAIGLSPTDGGGELDPHGDDGLGNPVGGLVYSTGLPSGDNKTYEQTQSWNQFLDSNRFCFKLCDPNYKGDNKNYCQNIYDLLGCDYNAPAAYEPNVFLSCEGDLQDEVGTYTSNGQTITWSQPSSLAPGTTLPWTPRIPASSNCVTYQSTDLFPLSDLGYQSTNTMFGAAAAMTGSASGASGSSTSGSNSGSSASRSGSGSDKSTSPTSSGSSSSKPSGAASLSTGLPSLPVAFALFIGPMIGAALVW